MLSDDFAIKKMWRNGVELFLSEIDRKQIAVDRTDYMCVLQVQRMSQTDKCYFPLAGLVSSDNS